jgi:hypothetical protein
MRFVSWFLALGALIILGAEGALAQAPPPEPPVAENAGPLDGVLPACPTSCGSPSHTVDFLFGLPTGFRIERAVAEDRLWHLEGFVGIELIFPTVGGSLRRRYDRFGDSRNALVFAPGIDAYLLYNPLHNEPGFIIGGGPEFAFAVTADVDMMWRHSFTERCQSELGLKLGAGAGYGARWGVLPVGAVFTGIRW